jgi:hypothetical protein
LLGNASAQAGPTLTALQSPNVANQGLTPSTGSLTAFNQSQLTNNTSQPVFVGRAEAGATVEITDTVGGTATVLGTAKANSSGVWTFQATSILSGNHSITTKQTDIAGNVSTVSSPYTFTVDSTLMGLPALVSTGSNDSGISGDGITRNTTPTLTGVAVTKGGTVQVYDGTTLLGTTTSDASTGVWTFTPPTSLLGSATGVVHSITAKDVTANMTSSALSLTIDTSAAAPVVSAPVAANSNTAPTIAGTGAEANATVTLTAKSTDGSSTQTFTTTANASGAATL